MEFLPLPDWDHLHPLVVHFPVALLLVAPLLVILGALWKKHASGLLLAALLLMALGTAAAYVAVETGEAAAEQVERSPQIKPVLSHHHRLADRTRLVFTGLTTLFAAIVLLPAFLRRELKRPLALGLYAVFLLLYAGGTVLLANTAHNGGRLVHEFGVRAFAPPAQQTPVPSPSHP
jgi:uncharacterized membrane protein